MSEWVKVPDYQDMIGTECIGCGKPINLGYAQSALVPRLCDECKEAIKYAKKLMNDAINNALAVLKEQEAIEPISYHRSDGTIFKYECRKCRTKIFKMDLFCRHCGRPVKWE